MKLPNDSIELAAASGLFCCLASVLSGAIGTAISAFRRRRAGGYKSL